MLRTAQSLPQKGFRRWASTPVVSLRHRQPATGPPGSYPDRTHTGKRRRAYDQRSPTRVTSSLLGARMTGVVNRGDLEHPRAKQHVSCSARTVITGCGRIPATRPPTTSKRFHTGDPDCHRAVLTGAPIHVWSGWGRSPTGCGPAHPDRAALHRRLSAVVTSQPGHRSAGNQISRLRSPIGNMIAFAE
jgi:hypothetical protein